LPFFCAVDATTVVERKDDRKGGDDDIGSGMYTGVNEKFE
jgi:hypothetical protein